MDLHCNQLVLPDLLLLHLRQPLLDHTGRSIRYQDTSKGCLDRRHGVIRIQHPHWAGYFACNHASGLAILPYLRRLQFH